MHFEVALIMWCLTLAAFLQPVSRISFPLVSIAEQVEKDEMELLTAILCSCSDEFDCSGLSVWLQSKAVL